MLLFVGDIVGDWLMFVGSVLGVGDWSMHDVSQLQLYLILLFTYPWYLYHYCKVHLIFGQCIIKILLSTAENHPQTQAPLQIGNARQIIILQRVIQLLIKVSQLDVTLSEEIK